MKVSKDGITSLIAGVYSEDNWTTNGYALDADASRDYTFTIDKSNRSVTLQVIWTGTVGGSGTATLQVSTNGIDWTTVKDVDGNNVVSTVTGSANHDTITLINAAPGRYKIVYAHGTNGDGKIIINYYEG
jgi:uncharacterized protein (DUF2141 family)